MFGISDHQEKEVLEHVEVGDSTYKNVLFRSLVDKEEISRRNHEESRYAGDSAKIKLEMKIKLPGTVLEQERRSRKETDDEKMLLKMQFEVAEKKNLHLAKQLDENRNILTI